MTLYDDDLTAPGGGRPPCSDSGLPWIPPDMPGPWVKSARCGNSCSCVEVRGLAGGEVEMRNSDRPGAPVLRMTRDEMQAFLDGVRDHEFDRFGYLT